jgi:hypothetical protein
MGRSACPVAMRLVLPFQKRREGRDAPAVAQVNPTARGVTCAPNRGAQLTCRARINQAYTRRHPIRHGETDESSRVNVGNELNPLQHHGGIPVAQGSEPLPHGPQNRRTTRTARSAREKCELKSSIAGICFGYALR